MHSEPLEITVSEEKSVYFSPFKFFLKSKWKDFKIAFKKEFILYFNLEDASSAS